MNGKSYIDWSSYSDSSLLKQIGQFIQHHRLNQNRTQGEVSQTAGISRSTLSLLERGEKVTLISLIQVLRTLDLLYIMDTFYVDQQISPIAYAEMQKKQRQRARNSSDMELREPDQELGW